MIDINKIMLETCLGLKEKYSTLDCIIFSSSNYTGEGNAEVECWATELPSFQDPSYKDYNSQVSDEEWDDVYDSTQHLLKYLSADYGNTYDILVDFNKEEVRYVVGSRELPTMKFPNIKVKKITQFKGE